MNVSPGTVSVAAGPRARWLLWPTLTALLAARHLALYATASEFAHLDALVQGFARIVAGDLWVHSPELWETGLHLGGPLYTWISLPALLGRNPVVALHLYYGALELAGLVVWVKVSERSGLGGPLAWCSALLLAGYGQTSLVVCENMTVAAICAIPVFVVLLRALSRPGPRAQLLSGALLGLLVQVHQVAVVLLPGLLLAVVCLGGAPQAPRSGWRRLFWLSLGLLLAASPALVGAVWPTDRTVSGSLAQALSLVTVDQLVWRLGHTLKDPLAWGGMILALVGLARGSGHAIQRRAAGLAALCLGCAYPLLCLLLSVMDPAPREPRAALLNPPRALLAALLVCTLAGWVARRLPRRRRPGWRWAVLVAALVATALWGKIAADSVQLFRAPAEAPARGKGACDPWLNLETSRHFAPLYDELTSRPLPGWTGRGLVVVKGLIADNMQGAIGWHRLRRILLNHEQKQWLEWSDEQPTLMLAPRNLSEALRLSSCSLRLPSLVLIRPRAFATVSRKRGTRRFGVELSSLPAGSAPSLLVGVRWRDGDHPTRPRLILDAVPSTRDIFEDTAARAGRTDEFVSEVRRQSPRPPLGAVDRPKPSTDLGGDGPVVAPAVRRLRPLAEARCPPGIRVTEVMIWQLVRLPPDVVSRIADRPVAIRGTLRAHGGELDRVEAVVIDSSSGCDKRQRLGPKAVPRAQTSEEASR